ncbi:MAG: alpha/beta hydrolase [Leadbetterella sp.]
MKTVQIFFAAFALFFATSCNEVSDNVAPSNLKAGKNRVEFVSENVNLIGDLYLPTNFDANQKYPVLLFDGPQSGLKDQVAGVYARKLADAGYITLAYDHRFYGESGGNPRQLEAPQEKMIDNKNAVTYLLSLPFVDAEKVGGVGICAGGGIMSTTIADDKRVKALIGIAGSYNDASQYRNWFGGEANLNAFIQTAIASRQKYERTGEVDYILSVSNDPNQQAAMTGLEPTNEPFAYYGTERGYSPHYVNRMAVQSYERILTYDALGSANRITVPTLIIHGTTDLYTTPEQAKNFFGRLATTDKEYYEMTTTNHIDLYDRDAYVNRAVTKATQWINAKFKK